MIDNQEEDNKTHIVVVGYGDMGQLGSSKTCNEPQLATLSFSQPIKQISCGAYYTIILTEDGTCYSAGTNYKGQCARPSQSSQHEFLKVTAFDDDTRVDSVVCGFDTTFFLTKIADYKQVYASGGNQSGELCVGHLHDVKSPELVRHTIFSNDPINEVYAGQKFTLFETRNRELYLAGDPDSSVQNKTAKGELRKVTLPQQYLQVKAGKIQIYFLYADGTIGAIKPSDNIISVTSMSIPNEYIVNLYERDSYTIFTTRSGKMYGIGIDQDGLFTDQKDKGIQVLYTPFKSMDITDVYVGGYHVLFKILKAGVWVAGLNGFGQCGIGSNTRIPNVTKLENNVLDRFILNEVESKMRELEAACGASHTIFYSGPPKRNVGFFFTRLVTCSKFYDVAIDFL
jgi:alpha-tubulin suppressor-like RCC1 family protein